VAKNGSLDYALRHQAMIFTAQSLLWFSAQILQAGILIALVARGLHRQFPSFTAYIVLQMTSEPLLTLAQGRWPYIYYFGYWATFAATTILTVAILYEVVRQVWHPADAGQRMAARLVWVIGLFAIVHSAVGLLTSHAQSSVESVASLFLFADRDVRIVTCGVGLFILIFRKRLGVSWRDFGVGIMAGFVFVSAAHLTITTAMAHRTMLHRRTLAEINSGAYVLAELIWLVYATVSSKVPLGGSPGSTSQHDAWPGKSMYRSLRNLWNVDWAARAFPAAFRHE